MVKNGFAPIESDEYVTNLGVDRAAVIKQLEPTIGTHRAGAVNAESRFGSLDRRDRGLYCFTCIAGNAGLDQEHGILFADDDTGWSV